MSSMTPDELMRRYDAGERDFQAIDLARANLRNIDLSHANFQEASFAGANLVHARFSHCNLTSVDLVGADLVEANFVGADLHKANLVWANLGYARLDEAHLQQTQFGGAMLQGASFKSAILDGADFSGADLKQADFDGAQCLGLTLGRTVLADLDLSSLCRGNVTHIAPSYIDGTAIARSLEEPSLKAFLLAAGMAHIFVEFMVDCARSLSEVDLFSMTQSTFISYGGPDEAFARKLYEALRRNRVNTFFFPESAVPGEKLHRTMREGINSHDRMILICSKNSLDRSGVLNEIEEVLAREARDGGAAYLIPIRLDDYLFGGWNPPNSDVAQTIRDRVVADFRGADTDTVKFDRELLRLLNSIKKKKVSKTTTP